MPWLLPWRQTKNLGTSVGGISVSDPRILSLFGLGGSEGPDVTESTAISLSAAYRAVSIVSGSLASLPLRTLKTKPDNTRERSTSVFDEPGGDYLTSFEWKELLGIHLCLHGNAFQQHIYNGAGALVGFNPVHPLAVDVQRDADRIGGRRFDVHLGGGEKREFDASTMTQVMGLSLDGLKGISPISLARLSLSTALAGDKAAHRTLVNGAMISGLVTPEEDEELEEEEAKEVKRTVTAAMTGVENAGEIAVINKRLKFTPWQLSAVDAQFMASRAFNIDEIGRWWGVPPHLLGLTEKATSWGQGIAEQNRGLARYTLTPWTDRIEARLSRLITGTKIVEFDYTAFVAPSPEDEITLLLAQVNGGLITPDEARRVRNMPPLPNGQGTKIRIPAGASDPNAPKPAPAEKKPVEPDPKEEK